MSLTKRLFMEHEEKQQILNETFLSYLVDINKKLNKKASRRKYLAEELEDIDRDILVLQGKILNVKEKIEVIK